MTLNPVWRTRLFGAVAALVAVVLGVQIAQGAWFWPSLLGAGLLALLAVSFQSRPLLTLLLGAVVFGYIVGNRGFAQVSLLRSFPLLPGEAVLLAGAALLLIQCAWQRALPFRRDLLNFTLLGWMGFGALRLGFDVREHGFAAIRDFALVYYAAFFFLAQHAAREARSARWIVGAVLAGCSLLLVIHPVFSRWPEFFVEALTIRGIPVIFYKDDLVGNFMAVGSVLSYLRFAERGRWPWLGLSLLLAGLMLATASRSSMLALAIGAGWLALGGRWRFAGLLGLSGLLAAVLLVGVAEARNRSWRDTPVHRVYERVLSIADPAGQRAYESEEAFKGDNNLFRLVWWEASVTEAWETSPWLGLGFGHDLAGRFVRQYFPEGNEEFTARSPHNVLITVFARMGAVGFALFVGVLAAMTVRTFRAARRRAWALDRGGAWVAGWVLLVAACFGVVLEGPMGAVVFWTLLGVANAPRAEPTAGAPRESESPKASTAAVAVLGR